MGEKGNAAREKIIYEFRKLVLEQGYNNTTLRQLSNACGMSQGHLAFYFKKKEEIMIAHISRFVYQAQSVLNKCESLNDDDFLHFSALPLFCLYVTSRRKEVYSYMAEMSQNNIYLNWRIGFTYDAAMPVFVEKGICNQNDLLKAAIVSTYGLYGLIHQCYSSEEALDYISYFIVHMKGFFAQIGFAQGDLYIDKAVKVFVSLDIEDLMSQMQ